MPCVCALVSLNDHHLLLTRSKPHGDRIVDLLSATWNPLDSIIRETSCCAFNVRKKTAYPAIPSLQLSQVECRMLYTQDARVFMILIKYSSSSIRNIFFWCFIFKKIFLVFSFIFFLVFFWPTYFGLFLDFPQFFSWSFL